MKTRCMLVAGTSQITGTLASIFFRAFFTLWLAADDLGAISDKAAGRFSSTPSCCGVGELSARRRISKAGGGYRWNLRSVEVTVH